MMHINQSDYFDKIKKMGVIVLYGAGSKAKQAAKTLERLGINISEVCDNDTTRYGELFLGHTICSFEDVISRHDKDRVCVLLTVSINNALAIAKPATITINGTILFVNPLGAVNTHRYAHVTNNTAKMKSKKLTSVFLSKPETINITTKAMIAPTNTYLY